MTESLGPSHNLLWLSLTFSWKCLKLRQAERGTWSRRLHFRQWTNENNNFCLKLKLNNEKMIKSTSEQNSIAQNV